MKDFRWSNMRGSEAALVHQPGSVSIRNKEAALSKGGSREPRGARQIGTRFSVQPVSLGAGWRLLQPDTIGYRPNGLTWFLTRHWITSFQACNTHVLLPWTIRSKEKLITICAKCKLTSR